MNVSDLRPLLVAVAVALAVGGPAVAAGEEMGGGEGGAAVAEGLKGGPIGPDVPVLRVDGEPVGRIWYERALAQTAAELEPASEAHGMDNAMVRRTAMERLIEQEVLYALARREEIPDLDEEVERRFRAFVERVGGEEAFREQLASQGMEERHVRRIIRRELASAWYVENVIGRDVIVSEEEARSYYEARKDREYAHPEERKIYQILAAESRGKEAALSRLDEVRSRYEEGEGFGPLARELSDEPASRLVEGFIGVRTRDELPPEVAEACFSTKPGELTPVVHTRFGYHVFLVTEVIPPEDKSFEEVEDDVYRKARAYKLKKATKKVLKKAGQEIDVEVLLPH